MNGAGERAPGDANKGPQQRDASSSAQSDGLFGLELRDFRVVAQLGAGGMGVVYKAHQVSMDRFVALKVLPPHLAADAQTRERFLREARLSAKLDHPNIVRGIAVGEERAVHYFAMELVQGESLDKRLKRVGCIDCDSAIDIALAVARALEHAHRRGAIHRDIKPSNIILTDDGMVKLGDFGLARVSDDDVTLSAPGATIGTPAYMAPEQLRDAHAATERSDLYALGCTLFQLLTGSKPFAGATILQLVLAKEEGSRRKAAEINPIVPPTIDAVLDRLLAPRSDDRFPDATSLIAALETIRSKRVSTNAPLPAQPAIPAGGNAPRSASRRLQRVFISLILIVAAGTLISLLRPERPVPEQVADGAQRVKEAMSLVAEGDPGRARSLLEGGPDTVDVRHVMAELTGGLLVLGQLQQGGVTGPLSPLDAMAPFTLTASDNYRFALVAGRACHLYVYQVDSRPRAHRLFPNDDYASGENPVTPGPIRWLPGDSASPWLHLDNQLGPERVYFVASVSPMQAPEKVVPLLTSWTQAPTDERLATQLREADPSLQPCFAQRLVTGLVFQHR